jgi:hypothetical protein
MGRGTQRHWPLLGRNSSGREKLYPFYREGDRAQKRRVCGSASRWRNGELVQLGCRFSGSLSTDLKLSSKWSLRTVLGSPEFRRVQGRDLPTSSPPPFDGTGIQGLVVAKQALHRLSHISSPFCLGYFAWGFVNYLPELATN